MRKLSPPRRYAVLVATLLEVERDLTDAAIEMADALLGRAMAAAKRRREEAVAREADLRRDTFQLLVQLGEELVAANARGSDLSQAVTRVTDWPHLSAVVAAAGSFVRADEADVIGMLGAEHGTVRRWAPRFLEAFRFDGAPPSRSLRLAGCSGRGQPASCGPFLKVEQARMKAHSILSLPGTKESDHAWTRKVFGNDEGRKGADTALPKEGKVD